MADSMIRHATNIFWLRGTSGEILLFDMVSRSLRMLIYRDCRGATICRPLRSSCLDNHQSRPVGFMPGEYRLRSLCGAMRLSPPHLALDVAHSCEPGSSQVITDSDVDDRSVVLSSDGCAYRWSNHVSRGGLWRWGREGLACFSMCCTPVDLAFHLPLSHVRSFHLQPHCRGRASADIRLMRYVRFNVFRRRQFDTLSRSSIFSAALSRYTSSRIPANSENTTR
jgi:hypothetical protein